ncbi:hypothetical protein F4811DRAFT_510710 [Daldinia bambusicola]|nr:hypothetical protein F4811DRAFT_510710 [Daldinia bambusicola]
MEGIRTSVRDSKKSSELRYLRNELNRLKTYLAIHEYDLGLPEQKARDVSRLARKRQKAKQERQRGRVAQYAREYTRGGQSELQFKVREDVGSSIDKKLASYRSRIKKTSIQLVVAAAAGHEYRAAKLAAQEGGAFSRSDASDDSGISESSGSDVGDSDTDITDITDFSSGEISLPTSVLPAAMMSQIDKLPGPGDWADKLTQPVIAKYARRETVVKDEEEEEEDEEDDDDEEEEEDDEDEDEDGDEDEDEVEEEERDSRLLHKPTVPQPTLYDPKRWRDINYESNAEILKPDPRFTRTDKFPGEIGVMTWEQQEEAYPTLNSILERTEEYGRWDPGYLDESKPDPRLWDPDQKEQNESKPDAERIPLEANLTTKISLERMRAGFERPEMNIDYTPYSQIPAALPENPSVEVMMRGPLPTPLRLPLKGPSGRVIAVPSKPNTPAKQPVHVDPYAKTPSQDPKDATPPSALLAQYHYPIDSPATSTFKLKGRKAGEDVVKPKPVITAAAAEVVGKPFQVPYPTHHYTPIQIATAAAEEEEEGEVKPLKVPPPIHHYTPIQIGPQVHTPKVKVEEDDENIYIAPTVAEYLEEPFHSLPTEDGATSQDYGTDNVQTVAPFDPSPQEAEQKWRKELLEQQIEQQKKAREEYLQRIPDLASASLPTPLPSATFADRHAPPPPTPFDIPPSHPQGPRSPLRVPAPTSASAPTGVYSAHDPWWHYTGSDVDTALYPRLYSAAANASASTTGNTATATAPATATAASLQSQNYTPYNLAPPPRGPPSPLDLSAATPAPVREVEEHQVQAQVLGEASAAAAAAATSAYAGAATPTGKPSPSPFLLPLRSAGLGEGGLRTGTGSSGGSVGAGRGVMKSSSSSSSRRRRNGKGGKDKKKGHVRFGGTQTLTFTKDR